jgi:hypothetical protein
LQVIAKGGALEARVQARAKGCVQLLGITGRHDPRIVCDALRRFSFDAVLAAPNAACLASQFQWNSFTPFCERTHRPV